MSTDTSLEIRRQEVMDELRKKSMYEILGSQAGIVAIADRFYELMDSDPAYSTIRAMHGEDLGPIKELLGEFLTGWFGGPPLYISRKGSPCLSSAHAPFRIDSAARDEWMDCIERAMTDVGVDARYREVLLPAFGRMADMLRNT